MSDIKISIIVPLYNEEPFLKRCIESLKNQSYRNIEIIIVDDDSQDASREIIETYKKDDSRIFLYSQKHSGRYEAKNNGIHKATGEFLMFCDADDLLIHDAVQKCVEVLNKYPASDGVFFDYKKLEENKKISSDYIPEFLKEIPPYHICAESRYLPCFRDTRFCCIKRDTILNGNIKFENIPLYADILFLAKFLTYSYAINWINQKLYVYYQKPAHIKSYNVSEDTLRIFALADEVKKIYMDAGIWENAQGLHYYKFLLTMSLFEHEKLQYAKKEIQKSYRERLCLFINEMPYVYLMFIGCYIDWNIRVKLLAWHKDHSFELNLCERVYAKFMRKEKVKKIGRYLDKLCRCFLPSYRAATNLRKRQIAMQQQIEELIKEERQRKILLEEKGINEYELLLNSPQ